MIGVDDLKWRGLKLMKILAIKKVFFVSFSFFPELGGVHNTSSVRQDFFVTYGCFFQKLVGLFIRPISVKLKHLVYLNTGTR